jgi:hypothetical protein
MPSPFPGMDLFLEQPKLWPSFQHHLLSSLLQILTPGLENRYRTRMGTRQYVAEMPLFTTVLREEHNEQFGEIRNKTDGRLVTLIEIVSLGNRTTPAGRMAYLDKRREAIVCRAGIVEIDLVLQGKPTLNYSRDGLPVFDYAVTVTRSTTPERYEIYTATLAKRLPKFKLPLAQDDRDSMLDLQAAFARAYDLGAFGTLIDYKSPPPPDVPLGDTNRRWRDDLLKQVKLR